MVKTFQFLKEGALQINEEFYEILKNSSFLEKLKAKEDLSKSFSKTFFHRKRYRLIESYLVEGKEIFIKKYADCFKEAEKEWQNIQLLWKRGFPTSVPVFYYPREDAVLLGTEKIPGKLILEIIKEHPERKLEMLETLAKTLVDFHREGLFHQDCYLNHFYFDEKNKLLYILDVSRVLEKPFLKFYYQVKDLSQLKYSFLEYFSETWEKDWKIFFEAYQKFWGKPLGLLKLTLLNLKFRKIKKHTEKLKKLGKN